MLLRDCHKSRISRVLIRDFRADRTNSTLFMNGFAAHPAKETVFWAKKSEKCSISMIYSGRIAVKNTRNRSLGEGFGQIFSW